MEAEHIGNSIENPLKKGLLSIAVGSAEAFGYSFHHQALDAVSNMVESFIRVTGDNPDYGTIQSAQENILLITTLMVRKTKSLNINTDQLSLKIFEDIKALLCPLPPLWSEPCN